MSRINFLESDVQSRTFKRRRNLAWKNAHFGIKVRLGKRALDKFKTKITVPDPSDTTWKDEDRSQKMIEKIVNPFEKIAHVAKRSEKATTDQYIKILNTMIKTGRVEDSGSRKGIAVVLNEVLEDPKNIGHLNPPQQKVLQTSISHLHIPSDYTEVFDGKRFYFQNAIKEDASLIYLFLLANYKEQNNLKATTGRLTFKKPIWGIIREPEEGELYEPKNLTTMSSFGKKYLDLKYRCLVKYEYLIDDDTGKTRKLGERGLRMFDRDAIGSISIRGKRKKVLTEEEFEEEEEKRIRKKVEEEFEEEGEEEIGEMEEMEEL